MNILNWLLVTNETEDLTTHHWWDIFFWFEFHYDQYIEFGLASSYYSFDYYYFIALTGILYMKVKQLYVKVQSL